MVTREQIINTAREYLGTQYMHQARVKGEAVDCAGLLLCVGKELDIIPSDFDFVEYNRENDGSDLRRIIDMYAYEIPREEALPGDICVMYMFSNPQHCGFYSDIGIIQCTDKVVEHRLDNKWNNRIASSHRLNALES